MLLLHGHGATARASAFCCRSMRIQLGDAKLGRGNKLVERGVAPILFSACFPDSFSFYRTRTGTRHTLHPATAADRCASDWATSGWGGRGTGGRCCVNFGFHVFIRKDRFYPSLIFYIGFFNDTSLAHNQNSTCLTKYWTFCTGFARALAILFHCTSILYIWHGL